MNVKCGWIKSHQQTHNAHTISSVTIALMTPKQYAACARSRAPTAERNEYSAPAADARNQKKGNDRVFHFGIYETVPYIIISIGTVIL